MRARRVDERDARLESQVREFRAVVVHPGNRRDVFDIDDATLVEARTWAEELESSARVALALRVRLEDGGVGLLWLTPPPEAL